jgi:hypothetical protein
MKIRIATPEDEKLIDTFDEFKGNRPTEISLNEVWTRISNGNQGISTLLYCISSNTVFSR